MQNFLSKEEMQRRVAQALLCVSVFNLGMDITPKVVKGNISISSSDIAKAETGALKVGDTVKLSDLYVGDTFKASGIEWMVVAKNHEGYPGGSVTVMSKDILENRAFDDTGTYGSNHWGNSDLRKYLNGEFYNKLDPNFRAAILETNLVNIENEANNYNYDKCGAPSYSGKTYYTQDKIFIPSFEELGIKNISWARKVGEDYGAFKTNESRIAKLNGNNWYYWTRVPYYGISYHVCGVGSDGSYNGYYGADCESVGVRAALNLKSDILLEYTGNDSLVYNNEDEAYKIQLGVATNAIVKAESSKTQADVTSARDLVKALRPADKTALTARLDAVQKYIDTENAYKAQLATATNAVVKAEGSKLQGDVDAARKLVNSLRNSDKNSLNSRLDAVQKYIDTENAYKAQLTTATNAVVKAENSKLQADVTSARDLVKALRPNDKTALTARLDAVQKYIDTENAYKAQLATATNAVVKAEGSKAQSDVTSARNLVNNLRNNDKTALTTRLDAIQKYINTENAYKAQLATATNAVVKAESSKLQADVNSARNLVKALRPTDKTALTTRLDTVQKYIDTENAYKAQLGSATNAIVKAESSKTQADVNNARDLVKALRPNDKTALNSRLDAVQKYIDTENAYKAQLATATNAVIKAEGSKTQANVNSARNLVNALRPTDKTALTTRLDTVQKYIDTENAYKAQLATATNAVVKAENSKAQIDIDSARVLVNALPDGKEKTELTKRLDNLQQAIINDKIDELKDKTDISQDELDELQSIIDNLPAGEAKEKAEKDLQDAIDAITNIQAATKLVEKAEKTLLREDYNTAYSAVTALPQMKGKSELLNRLMKLNAAINRKDSEKRVQTLTNVRDAEKLVRKASISKSTEDIAKAQEAINKLPEGKNRDRLQTWLDSFADNTKLTPSLKLNYQRDAERAIKHAEIVRTQETIDAAQDKIDVLPDTMNIKTAYQSRLDRVTIKGSLESMSALDKLRAAEKAVKRAESNHTVESVTEAEKLVNALSDNDRKEFLQLRVTAEKLMQEAEKKPSEEKITAVQTAIGKLPYGNVKYNLLKRIAAVQKQLK